MDRNGLLIDYEYCSGCFSCVVACKQEHNLPVGRFGIRVFESVQEMPDRIAVDYIPFPTELCNLCAHLTSDGTLPSCVRHCFSRCMKYGPIEQLAREAAESPKTVIWCSPGASGKDGSGSRN